MLRAKGALHVLQGNPTGHDMGNLAERSKALNLNHALASGARENPAAPKGREFKSHSCQTSFAWLS